MSGYVAKMALFLGTVGLKAMIRKYIRGAVYGGTDGVISIFAVISSALGAALPLKTVAVICFATLIADAISMAVSDFLSQNAECAVRRPASGSMRELGTVKRSHPKIRDLLAARLHMQASPTQITTMADILCEDEELTNALLRVTEEPSPMISCVVTFLSFVTFGAVPLLAVMFSYAYMNPFIGSCLFTSCTLFTLGCSKAAFTNQGKLRSGVQVVLLGGTCSLVAYGVSNFINSIQAADGIEQVGGA